MFRGQPVDDARVPIVQDRREVDQAHDWRAGIVGAEFEAREAFLGARGLVANVSSDLAWRPNSAWTFAAGPRLSLADSEFMEDYYGVDGIQSAASGLAVNRARAGIRSFGSGAFAQYKMTPSWTTRSFIEYEHLTGAAGDSPVITTRGARGQLMIGLGLSYTFKAPL